MNGQAFGGGASDTLMHPIVALAMLLVIALMFFLPRKYAVVPFLVFAFTTPLGQQIYVAGVHLFALRIIIVAGFARIIWAKFSSKTDLCASGFNSVDKVFLLWALFRAFAVIATYGGDKGALIYQTGFLWDVLGGYFLLRFLIRDQEDIFIVIKTFAAIAFFVGIVMLNEKLRAQNLFGLLGGVPTVAGSREGSIRAQGPFGHAILAGSFAATLMPLFFMLWQDGRSKITALAGGFGATLMVWACASSTPLFSYLTAILGVCFWPLRKKMRPIRWGIAIGLIALHLVMKAPVWYLIARVDLIAGNSGYHRAMLIDQCIIHFSDWWLVGSNQVYTWGFDMWDLSNQFVAEAETGGLATLICFILMISRSFGRIGRARKIVEGDPKKEWFVWLFGVALFSHVTNFFGISYYDQTRISWFALLAMTTVATASILATETVTEEARNVPFARPGLAYPPLSSTSQPSRLFKQG